MAKLSRNQKWQKCSFPGFFYWISLNAIKYHEIPLNPEKIEVVISSTGIGHNTVLDRVYPHLINTFTNFNRTLTKLKNTNKLARNIRVVQSNDIFKVSTTLHCFRSDSGLLSFYCGYWPIVWLPFYSRLLVR